MGTIILRQIMKSKFSIIFILLLQCSIPADHDNVFDPANPNSILPILALNTSKSGGSTTPPGNYILCTITTPTAGSYFSCSSAIFTTSALCKANSTCTSCSSYSINGTSSFYQCSLKSSVYSSYSTCFSECK
jgi:hypothetical protein